MAPPFLKDLDKKAQDIQKDDYSMKKLLKVKQTTPHGFQVTAEHEAKKESLLGKMSVKYAHKASGYSLDKLELRPDTSMYSEHSIKGIAPGVKLSCKLDDSFKGDAGATYATDLFAVKGEVDLAFTGLRTNAAVAAGPLLLAGTANFKLPGEKAGEISDFAAGVGFGNKDWTVSVTATSKLSTFNVAGMWQPMDVITASVIGSVNPDKGTNSMSLGVMYKHDPKTTLRAKVNSEGQVTGVITALCAKKMTVSLTSQMDSKAKSGPLMGITCTLG